MLHVSGTDDFSILHASGIVSETFYRGSGKGGQHRNKTETGVRLVHPSGIRVECCDERKREQNRVKAWAEMERRLKERSVIAEHKLLNTHRVGQLSERGWTFCQWRDSVVNRSNGKSARYSDIMRGRNFERLA